MWTQRISWISTSNNYGSEQKGWASQTKVLLKALEYIKKTKTFIVF